MDAEIRFDRVMKSDYQLHTKSVHHVREQRLDLESSLFPCWEVRVLKNDAYQTSILSTYYNVDLRAIAASIAARWT